MKKAEMTAAEAFWYVLGCISFGTAYLCKVPVKKALSDFGVIQMTAAEKFWYVLGCIFFGAAYFAKIPVARALTEVPEIRARGELAQIVPGAEPGAITS